MPFTANSFIRQVTQDYPIHDMDPLESWHKQRVLLAGDAAHAVAPHSGQGASLALEDGVMLANCLVEAKGIDAAFELFEARRKSRAGKAVVLGRLSGSQKAARGWLSRRIRDLILPLVMPMAVRKQAELFPGP
ncbi:FAD-dependent oxidoreductase [Devosia sediminis]|uniref:FAD-dependent monooxygenase n=1 Tax=Devosia sediminis TaxID=2798801 RepID=A0A934J2B9_9HYPH|nr:FAD-dependent monooxygenase [Devosia sediminis]MBJ3786470.1 FAD-dependent monooxygenase [Devosia sediminis]